MSGSLGAFCLLLSDRAIEQGAGLMMELNNTPLHLPLVTFRT
ncbi:hypothetical protein [Trichocoleus sp. FACHB-262]|nr:hypothetical protein [Trichocoleus sp. FACHB-262]